MKGRFFALFILLWSLSLATAAGQRRAVESKSAPAAAAEPWTAPLTPGGHADLQGVWVNSSATPLERPKALEGRPFLTDEEVAELKRRADRIFKSGDADFASGDAIFLAALANVEHYRNPNATESSAGMLNREFDNRTSLIVDPPDGKIPALTPSENLHVVERFTRVAPDTISHEIAIYDSTTWTKPWTAAIRLKQTQEKLYEFACHEGSHDVMEGLLRAARMADKAAEEAEKVPK